MEKLGARTRRIASLYLGRWEEDRLVYAGKAATGYTMAAAREIRERLDPHITRKSPLRRRSPMVLRRITGCSARRPSRVW
ncbi:hypothetical protein [Chelativorans sp.]|uniref:ATP dependent DNA ligase n=1 Tax=Chelativorans sp. TaxID=2203393 RepID=UPI0035C6D1DF